MKTKLPEGWQDVELGNSNYFKILPSGIDKFEGDKDYLSTESIQGTNIKKVECKITYEERPSRANMQPVLNSIWFAKMKSTLKVYSFDEDNKNEIKKFILSTGFMGIKVNENKVYPKYLKFFFLSKLFNKEKDKLSTGSTQMGINNDFIRKIKLLIPSLPAQEKIIQILEKAEKLKQNREDADKLTKDYLRSVFYEMFGDPIKNNKKWNKKTLSSFGEIKTGNTPSRLKKEYYGDYIDWIKSDNLNTPYMFITSAQEKLSKEGLKVGRIVPKGSILVTCIAGSVSCIGNCAVTNKEVSFNQQINAIVPNKKTNTLFIYFLINISKKYIQSFSQKALKGIVSKRVFENISFISPPLPLQQKFAKIVEQVETLKEKQQKSKEKIDEMLNSLMQRAFNGELVK